MYSTSPPPSTCSLAATPNKHEISPNSPVQNWGHLIDTPNTADYHRPSLTYSTINLYTNNHNIHNEHQRHPHPQPMLRGFLLGACMLLCVYPFSLFWLLSFSLIYIYIPDIIYLPLTHSLSTIHRLLCILISLSTL